MVIGQFVEVIDNIPAKLLIRANWEFPKLSFFGEGYENFCRTQTQLGERGNIRGREIAILFDLRGYTTIGRNTQRDKISIDMD
jgi:hypothetical protein